ncbi:hypothetical protein [Stenotrophomonas sepilia]|uniref:hypothetical protein n=1 Tax=Stenotrophomonas sepilia TaxID=2860290 RepID=UPI0033414EA1
MTTDNKALAVDVLAVLRQIADGEGDAQVLAMRARSAVAGLIESCDHLKRDATNERWAAFHAALARVKGESA